MEIFNYNSALSEEEVKELSSSTVGSVHLTPTIKDAQYAITTYNEVYKLLNRMGIKSKGKPLKSFRIPTIVMCTMEGHPECHEQADFFEMNAIPTQRKEGNLGLLTIFSNLSSK